MDPRLPIALHLDPGQAQLHQLLAQLSRAIRSGALPTHWRMPPSRALALQAQVGRDTVVQAYAELCAQGLLQAQGRKGTFVAPMPAHTLGNEPRTAHTPHLARRLATAAPATVAPGLDWRLGQACTVGLPLSVWRAACKEAGRTLPPAGYGDPMGDLGLRHEIATWLGRKRGANVSPAQIVATQGAGQAIELLAQLLLRPGDVCAVENPGYLRAAQAFAAQGAQVLPLPVDAHGAQVQAVFDSGTPPALLHVTPAHHYPLGVPLAAHRRAQLLALAQHHGTMVLENEYDYEFAFANDHSAPLLAQAPEQVILVSTFAKAISPALRLGFVVAPAAIAARLGDLVESQRRHCSWPVQRSVAWLLASGELERHLRRLQRHFAALRALVRTQVQGLQSHGLHMKGDAGGLHVLLQMPTPSASRQLEDALRASGVQLYPLSSFTHAPSPHHGVLLGYGHMRLADLDLALAHLGRCVTKLPKP